MTELSECAQLVCGGDPDRFRDALFASLEDRERLFALYAFNLELAKIAPMVSEPMLGEIRLQWWRESLDLAQAGTPRRHAVAAALAEAMSAADLPRKPVEAMIDARANDLDPEFPADQASLAEYLRGTSGALTMLGAKALAPELAEQGLSAASEAGFAIGAARYLLAVPRLAGEGRRALPAKISWASAASGEKNGALREAVSTLANAGLAAARSAREAGRGLPRSCAPAVLELATAERTLRSVRNAATLEELSPPSAFAVQFGRLWRGSTGRW